MQEVSDSVTLQSDEVIGGTYRIETAVARGGFSTIYRARHVEMGRRVALKVLTLGEDVGAGALERFSQEARLACQLVHPNVVTVHQFGQDDRGLLYIAMEWLEGLSLTDAVKARGPFPPARVAEIGRQIAAGLAAVHDLDVLHRDLKPSNVMLTELTDGDEIAKLLDFGVAKSIAPDDEGVEITQDGMFVGTPRYASPEQIRGHNLTPHTDIYGVGLLMWEILTGEPAVPTIDFEECCAHHLSADPWRLPDEANVPAPLAEVVHRSLRKNPDERYGSCTELKEALDEAARELPENRSPAGAEASTWSYYSMGFDPGWMKLIFASLVGTAVLALAGYQVWLSFADDGATVEERAANLQRDVESSDDLMHALSRRQWEIVRSERAENDSTVYSLAKGDSNASVRLVPEDVDSERKGETRIDFPTFSARVDPRKVEGDATLYRLLADLYAIRAAISDSSPQ